MPLAYQSQLTDRVILQTFHADAFFLEAYGHKVK